MKNNKIIILTLTSIVLLFLKFCSNDREQIEVKIVIPPSLIASLPHWVALKNQYYEKAGIHVHTIDVNDSKIMMSALYSKDADILPAVSLVDVITSSINKLLKPKIFSHSRMKLEPAFEALLVPFGSEIGSLKDLENKKIAVYPGATSAATVKYYLASQNIYVENIKFIPLPPPEHIRMLLKDEIQCSHCYEPFKSSMLKENKTRPISQSLYAYFNEPSAIGVSVISPYFYDSHPELADKILKIWDKSVKYIREHNAESRFILSEKLGLDNDIAMKSVWVDVTLLDEFDKTVVNRTIETYKKIGLLESSFEISNSYFLNKNNDKN